MLQKKNKTRAKDNQLNLVSPFQFYPSIQVFVREKKNPLLGSLMIQAMEQKQSHELRQFSSQRKKNNNGNRR